MTNDSLSKAIAYLGAVCVRTGITETIIGGDGKGPNRTSELRPALYAYRDRNAERFYTIDRNALFDLQRRLNQTDSSASAVEDAYQDWCDATEATGLPTWWSPERRSAWRHGASCKPGPRTTFATNLEPSCERITADLETGAEVPA